MKNRTSRLAIGAAAAGLAACVALPVLASSVRTPAHEGARERVQQLRPAAVDAATTNRAEAPVILGAVVTDTDPRRLAGARKGRSSTLPSLASGTFDPRRTLEVFVVTLYDRRTVTNGFDQVTRFRLPDGSVYEARVTPVDPHAGPDARVERPDLAPYPVRVQDMPRLRRVARMLPEGVVADDLERHAVFTSVPLPVSGTWITQHNLYGTWQVEIDAVQDNEVVASTTTTFTLER